MVREGGEASEKQMLVDRSAHLIRSAVVDEIMIIIIEEKTNCI